MAGLIKEFLRGLKPATWLSRQVSMREFLSKSIAGGLSAGDQVVLSDMSKWDGQDRLGIE